MVKPKKSKKTGPKPDTLSLTGDWQDAMGKAVKKKRPKDGWPEQIDKEGQGQKSEK